jgi:hypothetical protein
MYRKHMHVYGQVSQWHKFFHQKFGLQFGVFRLHSVSPNEFGEIIMKKMLVILMLMFCGGLTACEMSSSGGPTIVGGGGGDGGGGGC